MSHSERAVEVIDTLIELNDVERAERRQSDGPPRKATGRVSFFLLGVAPFLLALAFAVLSGFLRPDLMKLLSVLSLAGTYIGICVYFSISAFVHRNEIRSTVGNPMSTLLEGIRLTTCADSKIVGKLCEIPDAARAFALMEVRHEIEFLERRVSVLLGPLQHIGLLPGIAALAEVWTRVDDLQVDWITGVAYAVPPLYLMGLVAHFQVMRLRRMAGLLEQPAVPPVGSTYAMQPTPKSGAADG